MFFKNLVPPVFLSWYLTLASQWLMVVMESPVNLEMCILSWGPRSERRYLPSEVRKRLETNWAWRMSRCWGFQLDCLPLRLWTEYISLETSSNRRTSVSIFMVGSLAGIEDFGVVAFGRTFTMSAMSDSACFRGRRVEDCNKREAFGLLYLCFVKSIGWSSFVYLKLLLGLMAADAESVETGFSKPLFSSENMDCVRWERMLSGLGLFALPKWLFKTDCSALRGFMLRTSWESLTSSEELLCPFLAGGLGDGFPLSEKAGLNFPLIVSFSSLTQSASSFEEEEESSWQSLSSFSNRSNLPLWLSLPSDAPPLSFLMSELWCPRKRSSPRSPW